MKKISICTVCMNRLIHLSQTLPANINDNRDYPELEFVILNYNSKDGMHDWIKTNMMPHIESGLLKYYITTEPEYFQLSHSKNIAMKLATGDIVCMIDADNYAGPGYAAWINQVYMEHGDNTIVTTIRPTYIPYRDQGGKFAVSRSLLLQSRGMDEKLEGYGVDDVDLLNRIEKLGGTRHYIEDQKFLRYISHSNIDRIRNFHLLKNLREVYLCTDYEQPFNDVFYFLNDGAFINVKFDYREEEKANLISTYSGWSIPSEGYKRGTSMQSKQGLLLNYNDDTALYLNKQGTELFISEEGKIIKKWKMITEQDSPYYPLLMSYGECFNRMKLRENAVKEGEVNPGDWGKATLYKNFDMKNPISL